MNSYRLKIFTLALIQATSASALTLNEFIQQVEKKNPALEANRLERDASELKKSTGDLTLSPYLQAGYRWADDQRLTPMQLVPPIFTTETQTQTYSLGVAKKFSTGTTTSIGVAETPVNITTSGGPQPKLYTGTFSLILSQSLWKDFFGRSTRLRHNREELISQIEKTSSQVSTIQTLVSAESAYWNALYQQNEFQVRLDSLERARRLFEWTRARVKSGIAQQNDLLQVEALQSQRELQLISSQDNFKAAQKSLKDFLFIELSADDVMVQDAIDQGRPQLISELDPSSHLRADALIARLNAQLQSTIADETHEGLKPDLQLQAAYSGNGMNSQLSESVSGSFKNEHPVKSIGIQLTMDLDPSGQNAVKRAADLTKQSSDLKFEKLKLESDHDLSELKRRYGELTRRIEAARKLTKIQKSKYENERRRLENGRTTTFQVINFEQDAAEAELLLNQLLTEQRKLEANAQIFLGANSSISEGA